MKYLFLLSPWLAIPQAAQADVVSLAPEPRRDSEITVIATGSLQRVEDAGQSVSIVGAEEFASVQGPDLARVLERLPGVSLTRNGGLGGFTGLRIRGSNAEQVLVLVDGVRVADVASPGGGYDFGNMLAGGVDKLELLRGSNSVIWGSQAMGGVVAVSTRETRGVEGAVEYGARDSLSADGSVGLGDDRYGVTLLGGYARTDGFSSAASGTEADGFRQWRVGGKARAALAPGLALTAVARYADSKLDMDGYPAPTYSFADTPEYQTTREFSGRAALLYASDALTLDGGVSGADMRRAYFDPTFGSDPNFVTRGRSERADLRGQWAVAGGLRLNFGADSEWSRFSTSFDTREKARLSSAHALLGWSRPGIELAAGVRLDDHSRFGHAWTFGANGNVRLGDGWRLRASYGEGFKAPTLYQLYSDYGNLALSPERSHSYDVALEHGDRNGPLHLAVTAFRRDTRNLIDYVSCFSASDPLCGDGRYGFYANVGRARAEGLEVELGAQVSERMRAQAAYTFVKATDRTRAAANRGNDLARRPRHAVTVSVDWRTPLRDLSLGADLRMVSDSFDDAGNLSRLDGHALATLRASLPVTDAVELFGRIENLADARYTTVAGYGMPGRSAYLGARARF